MSPHTKAREGIFVLSELMETLAKLDLVDVTSPGFSGYYRERATFEKTYVRVAMFNTLGRLYGVRQWPRV